jgi:hypothetical protein
LIAQLSSAEAAHVNPSLAKNLKSVFQDFYLNKIGQNQLK